MSTSPLDREILTHYFVSPEPFPRCTDCIAETIARFVESGLLVQLSEPNKYGSSIEGNHDALRVYMEALGEVPFPVLEWVMP